MSLCVANKRRLRAASSDSADPSARARTAAGRLANVSGRRARPYERVRNMQSSVPDQSASYVVVSINAYDDDARTRYNNDTIAV